MVDAFWLLPKDDMFTVQWTESIKKSMDSCADEKYKRTFYGYCIFDVYGKNDIQLLAL